MATIDELLGSPSPTPTTAQEPVGDFREVTLNGSTKILTPAQVSLLDASDGNKRQFLFDNFAEKMDSPLDKELGPAFDKGETFEGKGNAFNRAMRSASTFGLADFEGGGLVDPDGLIASGIRTLAKFSSPLAIGATVQEMKEGQMPWERDKTLASKAEQVANPIATGAGKFVGGAVPGLAVGLLTGGTSLAAMGGGAAAKTIAAEAILGAAQGLGEEISDAGIENRDFNYDKMVLQAGIGGVAGGAFQGGAIVVSKALNRYASKVASEVAAKAALMDEGDKSLFAELSQQIETGEIDMAGIGWIRGKQKELARKSAEIETAEKGSKISIGMFEGENTYTGVPFEREAFLKQVKRWQANTNELNPTIQINFDGGTATGVIEGIHPQIIDDQVFLEVGLVKGTGGFSKAAYKQVEEATGLKFYPSANHLYPKVAKGGAQELGGAQVWVSNQRNPVFGPNAGTILTREADKARDEAVEVFLKAVDPNYKLPTKTADGLWVDLDGLDKIREAVDFGKTSIAYRLEGLDPKFWETPETILFRAYNLIETILREAPQHNTNPLRILESDTHRKMYRAALEAKKIFPGFFDPDNYRAPGSELTQGQVKMLAEKEVASFIKESGIEYITASLNRQRTSILKKAVAQEASLGERIAQSRPQTRFVDPQAKQIAEIFDHLDDIDTAILEMNGDSVGTRLADSILENILVKHKDALADPDGTKLAISWAKTSGILEPEGPLKGLTRENVQKRITDKKLALNKQIRDMLSVGDQLDTKVSWVRITDPETDEFYTVSGTVGDKILVSLFDDNKIVQEINRKVDIGMPGFKLLGNKIKNLEKMVKSKDTTTQDLFDASIKMMTSSDKNEREFGKQLRNQILESIPKDNKDIVKLALLTRDREHLARVDGFFTESSKSIWSGSELGSAIGGGIGFGGGGFLGAAVGGALGAVASAGSKAVGRGLYNRYSLPVAIGLAKWSGDKLLMRKMATRIADQSIINPFIPGQLMTAASAGGASLGAYLSNLAESDPNRLASELSKAGFIPAPANQDTINNISQKLEATNSIQQRIDIGMQRVDLVTQGFIAGKKSDVTFAPNEGTFSDYKKMISSWQQNPQEFLDTVIERIPTHPSLEAQNKGRMHRIMEDLQKREPKTVNNVPPSPGAIRSFENYANAAMDPEQLLQEINNGFVHQETIDATKLYHPANFAYIASKFAGQDLSKLDSSRRAALVKTFGYQVLGLDPMTPQLIQSKHQSQVKPNKAAGNVKLPPQGSVSGSIEGRQLR